MHCLIGKTVSDDKIQKFIDEALFKVLEGPEGKPEIEVMFKEEKTKFKPEEITEMLLVKLKSRADKVLQMGVSDVVLTVPYSFDDK